MNSKSSYRITFSDGLEIIVKAISEDHATLTASVKRSGYSNSSQKVVSRIEKLKDGNNC